MYLLFADESGTPSPPSKVHKGEAHFVLGALITHYKHWDTLNSELTKIKAKYGTTEELKWRYFRKRKGPLAHLNDDERAAMRHEMFSLIRSANVTLVAVVIDQASAYSRGDINSETDLYNRAYKILSERFQYFLQDASTPDEAARGMLILDNRGPRDDQLLQQFHHELIHSGGSYTSKYTNFVEGLFIAPSHLSVGIQLADLVAGAVFRKHSKNDSQFYDLIAGRFRTNRAGRIAGFGIARFPM